MSNPSETRAESAMRAASETRMSGTLWSGAGGETRIYLRRTNAARTEAGYIRLFVDAERRGRSQLCGLPVGGKGSMTASAEARATYARYKAILAEKAAAKNQTSAEVKQ